MNKLERYLSKEPTHIEAVGLIFLLTFLLLTLILTFAYLWSVYPKIAVVVVLSIILYPIYRLIKGIINA